MIPIWTIESRRFATLTYAVPEPEPKIYNGKWLLDALVPKRSLIARRSAHTSTTQAKPLRDCAFSWRAYKHAQAHYA